jgi:heat shock protein HtpX
MFAVYLKNFIACLITSLSLAGAFFLLAGPIPAAAAFLIGIGINVLVFYNSHRIINAFYAPIIVSPESAKELYVILADLSKAAKISLPILYASASPQPNMSVISRKNEHKIIISKNVIQLLDRRELHAMLAHHVAYIASGTVQHKSYVACIASLPVFFIYLGIFFASFGGKPTHKAPQWMTTLFQPVSWFSHAIAFICQNKKNTALIDILAITIGAHAASYFKGINKISIASSRIKDPQVSLFPALATLYITPPISFKRLNIGVPVAERLTKLRNNLESSGSRVPAKTAKNKKTSSASRGTPRKRPGVASGPSRSRPR